MREQNRETKPRTTDVVYPTDGKEITAKSNINS